MLMNTCNTFGLAEIDKADNFAGDRVPANEGRCGAGDVERGVHAGIGVLTGSAIVFIWPQIFEEKLLRITKKNV